MRCQRAVFLAAFCADGLFLAGRSTAGVSFLLAKGVPHIFDVYSLFLKLGFEICKGFAAALAAEPVILIVVAVVDIPDMQVFENIVNGYRAISDAFNDLSIIYRADEVEKLLIADVAEEVERRMQIMTRALVDELIIGGNNRPLSIHVIVVAFGALIIGFCTVFGAGRRCALYALQIFASAGAGFVILMAACKLFTATEAVGVACVACFEVGGLGGVSYLGAAVVVIRVTLTVIITAGAAGIS